MECLFIAEMTQPNSKGKQHLEVALGERISIIIASHSKLPRGKYLAEKRDGTGEYIYLVSVCLLQACVQVNFMQTFLSVVSSWFC